MCLSSCINSSMVANVIIVYTTIGRENVQHTLDFFQCIECPVAYMSCPVCHFTHWLCLSSGLTYVGNGAHRCTQVVVFIYTREGEESKNNNLSVHWTWWRHWGSTVRCSTIQISPTCRRWVWCPWTTWNCGSFGWFWLQTISWLGSHSHTESSNCKIQSGSSLDIPTITLFFIRWKWCDVHMEEDHVMLEKIKKVYKQKCILFRMGHTVHGNQFLFLHSQSFCILSFFFGADSILNIWFAFDMFWTHIVFFCCCSGVCSSSTRTRLSAQARATERRVTLHSRYMDRPKQCWSRKSTAETSQQHHDPNTNTRCCCAFVPYPIFSRCAHRQSNWGDSGTGCKFFWPSSCLSQWLASLFVPQVPFANLWRLGLLFLMS